jgi:hypothetical protein
LMGTCFSEFTGNAGNQGFSNFSQENPSIHKVRDDWWSSDSLMQTDAVWISRTGR